MQEMLRQANNHIVRWLLYPVTFRLGCFLLDVGERSRRRSRLIVYRQAEQYLGTFKRYIHIED